MAMEIIIHSTLISTPGKVTVVAEPDQPIDSLITAFCIEKNIRHDKKFVLKNNKQETLANTSKISSYNIQNGDTLFLCVKEYEWLSLLKSNAGGEWICGCNQWWILAGAMLFIGCTGMVAIAVIKVVSEQQPYSYGVVFDAGSSHTRMFIYKWNGQKTNNTAVAKQSHSCEVKDGAISSFAQNPGGAGASLHECLQEARSQIPDIDYHKTGVYLGATAGMRLLREQDNVTAQRIMDSVRQEISKSGFNFHKEQAKIIEGSDEGSFSWVTLNYLSDKFADTSVMDRMRRSLRSLFSLASVRPTYGALDMGGASTQITFVPKPNTRLPKQYEENLLLYGDNYTVYTHSYLCYGINEAFRQLLAELVLEGNYSSSISNPCAPSGYAFNQTYSEIFEVPCTQKKGYVPPLNYTKDVFVFHGTSNATACLATVSKLFRNATCKEPRCTFDGVYQPELNGKIVGFSSYYYVAQFFNQTQRNTLANYTQTVNDYCAMNWNQVQTVKADKNQRPHLYQYCFEGHYVLTLLAKYGFTTEKQWTALEFINQVKESDLGWSLGFMLNASNTIPQDLPQPAFEVGVFVLLVILFAVFVFLAVLFGCYARSFSKSRNADYQRLQSYGTV